MPTTRTPARAADAATVAVAALAAFSARETYRIPMKDLGQPRAVPLPKSDYERLRNEAMA